MKGTLHKTEEGWVVEYAKHAELPLHPDDVNLMPLKGQLLNDQHILNGMEVEFEIVKDLEILADSFATVSYAKIINQVPDVRKMIEDDYIEELAKGEIGWYDKHDDDQVKAFIAGYNKAKSTLYTEEDMYMLASKVVDDIAKNMSNADWNMFTTPKMIADEFIQSLKQPKQD